jgi:hypothetical protein
MKVLVGCEYSGIVSEAFGAKGHQVTSCDLNHRGENVLQRKHYIDDVFKIASLDHYDLAIFFPPCTYLCRASMAHINSPGRKESMSSALDFVRRLWALPIDRIAIENPIGKLSTLWRPPSQIIYPWYYGDNYSKDICLWLKRIPRLNGIPRIIQPEKLRSVSNHVNGRMSQEQKSKRRSLFFPTIAAAMAEQWNFIV